MIVALVLFLNSHASVAEIPVELINKPPDRKIIGQLANVKS